MAFRNVGFGEGARNVTAQHRHDNVLGVEVTCIVKRNTKSTCLYKQVISKCEIKIIGLCIATLHPVLYNVKNDSEVVK